MGKKRENNTKSRKKSIEKNQDNDARYSIDSRSDLSLENLNNVLRYNRYAQILLLLTFVGLILRFYHLDFNSLWLDEGATLDFAQRSITGIWEATAGGEFNPPLFYYVEHAMLLFGNSEWVLRFIPALLGTLTIPVMYFIGRELIDENGGLIAAALMTFSTFHLFYSQDARAYTTMLFFFSLALIAYLWALQSKNLFWWIICGVFSALAFWSHFYVFIPVVILFVHALIVKKEEILTNIHAIKPILFSGLTFLIISLPVILVTIPLFFRRTGSAPTWGLSGIDVIFSTIDQMMSYSLVITIVFLILALLGILKIYQNSKSNALLIVLCLVVPFIVSLILSAKMPMSPRYMIYLLPFFFVSIAGSYLYLPKMQNPRKILVAIVVVLFVINIPFYSSYYSNYTKNDWRGFAEVVEQNTNLGDAVVVLPACMGLPFDYYYDNSTDLTLEYLATTGADLEEILASTPAENMLFFHTWDLAANNPEGDAALWLSQNTEYLGQYGGISVYGR